MTLIIHGRTNPPLPQTVYSNEHGSIVFEANMHGENTMDLWDNHPKLIERIDPIFDLPFKAEYVDVVTPTYRQTQELKTYLKTPLLFVHRRKVVTGILYHAKPMDDTEEHLMVSYLTEWFQASIDGLVETVMYNRNGEHVAPTYPVSPETIRHKILSIFKVKLFVPMMKSMNSSTVLLKEKSYHDHLHYQSHRPYRKPE